MQDKICASIADSDDGWGRGVYKVADVPDLPVHPNCRCAISAYWLDKPTISNFISDVKPTTFETSIDEVAELFRKIDIHTASKDDIIKLGQVFNQKYSISDKIGDKDAITKAVSVYRQTGGTVSEDKWVERSVKAVKSALNEAFNHYPTDWVNYLNNTSEVIFAGKNQRGFYIRALLDASGKHYKIPSWVKTQAELAAYIEENNNGKYNTIYSSGRPTTAWHEIGHFVEDHNADVVRIEKEFVEARTKGEKETRLRDIYRDNRYGINELTKKDNFISPYIGKTYPNATEVLSVGLESIFEPGNGKLKYIDESGKRHYAKITDDQEYLNLILGLLLKG
ncbi:hypothetical protein SAMN05216431_102141 [Ligilactobacillus sp. WC1T17]|uniref:Phage head morphogenesis domain-containing protein n=1 Tax=Ligilactobacillus ruminis TaxID=1623 RepID=A0ABY1A9R4_9LACO|nr:hypothetical protein SAMN05216431_102141 [Ligilactobacillus ruminis]